tara:strand:- start:376 stop:2151 length:1776 start_codon:yes stop_codon:yes gene_type:complete
MFHPISYKTKESSADLVSWGHWFMLFNGFIAILCGTRYVIALGSPDTFLGWTYLLVNGISHFIFLAFCVYLLTLFPLSLFLPFSKILRGAGALIATVAIATLWFDIKVFRSYGIHLSPLSFDLAWTKLSDVLRWPEFTLSTLLLFVTELIVANWIWKRIKRIEKKRLGKKITAFIALGFITTHVMHIWADINEEHLILAQDKMFPLSYPATARTLIHRHGLQEKIKQNQQHVAQQLHYPQEPLQCNATGNFKNILVVGVEGWSADFIDEKTMPFFVRYAQDQVQFSAHYSGGTYRNAGLFSLLYSLQGSYIDAIDFDYTPPVFQSVLQQHEYNMVAFRQKEQSIYPKKMLDGFTLYATLQNENMAYGDAKTVQQFLDWKSKQDQHWFSLVTLSGPAFYDVPEGFIGIPSVRNHQKYNTAERVLFNQYRQSLFALDLQLQKLISNLDPDTIVVLTGVYGQVFSSSSKGTRERFARSALHVPMVLHDQALGRKTVHYKTHHTSMMPTILTEYFACTTPTQGYSSSQTLLQPNSHTWLYMGDKEDFAIHLEDSITVIDPHGQYAMYDMNFKPLTKPRLPAKEIIEVIKEGQRFF